MKKNIVVVFLMCWLAGCGGSNNDTSQSPSLSENASQPPPVNTLPSNPIEKPTIDYDEQLIIDIEEFVKSLNIPIQPNISIKINKSSSLHRLYSTIRCFHQYLFQMHLLNNDPLG